MTINQKGNTSELLPSDRPTLSRTYWGGPKPLIQRLSGCPLPLMLAYIGVILNIDHAKQSYCVSCSSSLLMSLSACRAGYGLNMINDDNNKTYTRALLENYVCLG